MQFKAKKKLLYGGLCLFFSLAFCGCQKTQSTVNTKPVQKLTSPETAAPHPATGPVMAAEAASKPAIAATVPETPSPVSITLGRTYALETYKQFSISKIDTADTIWASMADTYYYENPEKKQTYIDLVMDLINHTEKKIPVSKACSLAAITAKGETHPCEWYTAEVENGTRLSSHAVIPTGASMKLHCAISIPKTVKKCTLVLEIDGRLYTYDYRTGTEASLASPLDPQSALPSLKQEHMLQNMPETPSTTPAALSSEPASSGGIHTDTDSTSRKQAAGNKKKASNKNNTSNPTADSKKQKSGTGSKNITSNPTADSKKQKSGTGSKNITSNPAADSKKQKSGASSKKQQKTKNTVRALPVKIADFGNFRLKDLYYTKDVTPAKTNKGIFYHIVEGDSKQIYLVAKLKLKNNTKKTLDAASMLSVSVRYPGRSPKKYQGFLLTESKNKTGFQSSGLAPGKTRTVYGVMEVPASMQKKEKTLTFTFDGAEYTY